MMLVRTDRVLPVISHTTLPYVPIGCGTPSLQLVPERRRRSQCQFTFRVRERSRLSAITVQPPTLVPVAVQNRGRCTADDIRKRRTTATSLDA